jgi:hypothetical protein
MRVAAPDLFSHPERMNLLRARWSDIRCGMRGMWLALAALAGSGAGCVQLELTDSTTAPRYAPVIGRRYELTQDFIVRSVRVEVGEAPSFAYIIAKPAVYIPQYDPRSRRYDPQGKPGYVTRFVTDLGFLPAGTRFAVKGALTREAPFVRMNYLIEIEGSGGGLARDLPVRLGEQWGKEIYLAPMATGQAPEPYAPFFRPVVD